MPGTEKEDRRWIWGLAAIDQLLTCFQFPLETKLQLVSQLKDLFAREFKPDKTLKIASDQKYRHYRAAILEELDAYARQEAAYQAPYCQKSLALLESVSRQLRAKSAAGSLEVPLTEIVSSFIHLHVNRLIPGQQRLHELLLYDFLCRHYKTKLALEKKNSLFFAPDNPLF
jgi:thiopeptide-type bacteriocin biosynthesis protein